MSKPNILVIWGDDIGVHNISAYNHGIMGYRTPSIDRIAKEGALFTDAYAQQSCTAGRASFILGQHPFRVLIAHGLEAAGRLAQKNDEAGTIVLATGEVSRGQLQVNKVGYFERKIDKAPSPEERPDAARIAQQSNEKRVGLVAHVLDE